MQADQEQRVSFFDDDDTNIRFEFKKVSKNHTKELSQPPILRSILTKHVMNSSGKTEGVYALHGRLLAYFKSSSSKAPENVLELSHAKIKFIEPSSDVLSPGFCIFKNGNAFEFYSSDKSVIEQWFELLKSICVMISFHDEYKALKMIGKGSFAKVYLVEHKTNSKMYAVKAFTKESVIASNKANAKPSMLNEIEIMRSLEHENIIKLYEVHETEKSIYLVLELIQGKSLQDVLKRPTFRDEYSEVKVINMIRSILDALSYLAAKGVMHRDLKPDNILLDKDGKIKIADFGLATFVDVSEYIFKKCGTPGYIAPEVFKYDQKNPFTNYDHQCDSFSAGCIMFYMLFGYPFFEASNASEILRLNRKFTGEFDAILAVKQEIKNPNTKISRDGLNLLLQLLEFDPKKRASASNALCHPYFIPVPLGMQKRTGSNDLIPDIVGKNQSGMYSPMTPKQVGSPMGGGHGIYTFGNKGGESPTKLPLSQMIKERFAEKDSLYLDMGKTELNGKVDTLNTAVSHNNSILLRKDSNASIGSAQDSPSSFAKGSEKRSRSFRVHGATQASNQSVLKAALLRNAAKNNEGNEEYKEEAGSPMLQMQRNKSDRVNHRFSVNSGSERNSSQSQEPESEEDGVNDSPGGRTEKKKSFIKRRFKPFASKGTEAK